MIDIIPATPGAQGRKREGDVKLPRLEAAGCMWRLLASPLRFLRPTIRQTCYTLVAGAGVGWGGLGWAGLGWDGVGWGRVG